MPDKIAILIDNAYFQSIMRDEFGRPRIDYGALAHARAVFHNPRNSPTKGLDNPADTVRLYL